MVTRPTSRGSPARLNPAEPSGQFDRKRRRRPVERKFGRGRRPPPTTRETALVSLARTTPQDVRLNVSGVRPVRDVDDKRSGTGSQHHQGVAAEQGPGKRTLTERLPAPFAPVQQKPVQRKIDAAAPVMPSASRPTLHDLFGAVQRKANGGGPDTAAVHDSAQRGIATSSSSLPLPHERDRRGQHLSSPRRARPRCRATRGTRGSCSSYPDPASPHSRPRSGTPIDSRTAISTRSRASPTTCCTPRQAASSASRCESIGTHEQGVPSRWPRATFRSYRAGCVRRIDGFCLEILQQATIGPSPVPTAVPTCRPTMANTGACHR